MSDQGHQNNQNQQQAEHTDNTEAQQTSSRRRPEQGAYDVKNTPDGNAYWNKIGAAWKHEDGHGSTIKLDSIPLSGEITLRDLRDQKMGDYQKQQEERSVNERDQSRDVERSPQQSHER